MRSIILISPRSDEEKHIIDQWKDRSEYCRVVSEGRVTLKTGQGHLFIDFGDSEDMYAEYEDDALDFNIRDYYLYNISCSDLGFLKEFFRNTDFAEGSKLDNDFGWIADAKEIISNDEFFKPC